MKNHSPRFDDTDLTRRIVLQEALENEVTGEESSF
jgi:hypothetical protein